jgi:Do/DeqQ family serine protease
MEKWTDFSVEDLDMNTRLNFGRRAVRAGLAVAAAGLLTAGAAWHVGAANNQQAATQAQSANQTVTPIAHAVAGARDSYADVVNVVAPAVVTIRTTGKARMSPAEFDMPDGDLFRRFFGDQFGDQGRGQRQPRTFRQRALGSGVIVSTDGYLLTNNHVVEGADDIKVELTDGRSFAAKLVGSDKASDLAVLKMSANGLKALSLGNSDHVQVGDVVLAVGNPMGIGETVTMGIISAKGRSTGAGDGGFEDFLQTDAPINHGNSGGALVNTKGELVGINSQILSESGGNIGIGFAIPSNMARSVMDQLKTTGHVRRAQLGVTVQTLTSDLAEGLGLKDVRGVLVSSVAPGSAADHAGVKRGDVIASFNGQDVRDLNTLRNRVASTTPGSTADLTIIRDGSEKHLNVKLDELSAGKSARNQGQDSDSDDKSAFGVSVEPLTPELASRAGLAKDARGLLVEEVRPDSRAADAGIQSGDVIQEVNRKAVHSIDDLRAAMKSADRPLLLLVNREGHDLFMTVKPAKG